MILFIYLLISCLSLIKGLYSVRHGILTSGLAPHMVDALYVLNIRRLVSYMLHRKCVKIGNWPLDFMSHCPVMEC